MGRGAAVLVVEETIIRRIDMDGDRAVWMGDANTVLVGRHLDEEGVQKALADLSARWQRSFIRLVA